MSDKAGTPGRPLDSSVERAERLLAELELKAMLLVRRALAVATETAEDVWAEAEELRRRRKQPE